MGQPCNPPPPANTRTHISELKPELHCMRRGVLMRGGGGSSGCCCPGEHQGRYPLRPPHAPGLPSKARVNPAFVLPRAEPGRLPRAGGGGGGRRPPSSPCPRGETRPLALPGHAWAGLARGDGPGPPPREVPPSPGEALAGPRGPDRPDRAPERGQGAGGRHWEGWGGRLLMARLPRSLPV